MPSTAFHCPLLMPRQEMEAVVLDAADHLGQEAHVLGWFTRDNGEGLVVVYLDGSWADLNSYKDQVDYEVTEHLEALERDAEETSNAG